MDQTLQRISELCRDPMLAIDKGTITWMNAAAHRRFPALRPGDPAAGFLPEHILRETAETFLGSALLDGLHYTVSAAHDEAGVLLLTLVPGETRTAGFASDSLISGMLSSLFNIELSAERLRNYLEPGNGESEKYLAMLFHNYYALLHKLSNLNLARQFDDGDLHLYPQCFDLVALCQGLVLSTNHLIGEALAPIEFICGLDSLPACMDAARVELLLVNLLSNALKHTAADGHIRLRLARSGDNAVISVDDDGTGIPPEILTGVFQGYAAHLDAQSLSRADSGGLGLCLCRAIAEQHGGTLILESREQRGTSIRLMLPLRSQEQRLCSPSAPYENGGIAFLLTQLSDVLDWHAYRPEYLD